MRTNENKKKKPTKRDKERSACLRNRASCCFAGISTKYSASQPKILCPTRRPIRQANRPADARIQRRLETQSPLPSFNSSHLYLPGCYTSKKKEYIYSINIYFRCIYYYYLSLRVYILKSKSNLLKITNLLQHDISIWKVKYYNFFDLHFF